MRIKTRILLGIAILLLALIIWLQRTSQPNSKLILYGNVDQRQVELAFLDTERIEAIFVEEGSEVVPGQVLARLATRRLQDQIAIAEASLKQAQAHCLQLENGTRPEEKAQAKAQLAAARADLTYAEKRLARLLSIDSNSQGKGIRKTELDEAQSRLLAAKARVAVEENALRLAELGPRTEEIDQAKALVAERTQRLLELSNRLEDALLKAPSHSRINRRLLEPGDMAFPQKPVFSLVVLTPKWVRAYIAETDLAKIKPETKALIKADSLSKPLEGKVTYISSVAEFTPKTVETTELRTALVYEVRITVQDPADHLRLGMPVTVSF